MKTLVIFLAAGKSTRFYNEVGHHKALYKYHNQYWLEFIFNTIKIKNKVIITGHFHNSFEKYLPEYKSFFCYNSNHHLGQFHSLQFALKNFPYYDQFLIFPIDTFPPSHSLTSLILNSSSQYDVIIPKFQNKNGHPVLIRQSFAHKLTQLPPIGPKSRLDIQISLIAHYKKYFLNTREECITFNLNYKKDFDNLDLRI